MKALICGFLSFLIANTAYAAEVAEPSALAKVMQLLPMFAMVFGIFYLIVLMPQQKKFKEQQTMLSGLSKGQDVVTMSGIIGKVAGIEEDFILLEVAPNVRIRVLKDQVDKLFEKK